ncbi:MAG: transcriptional repressor [Ignavibacteriae bacterium HGW-Ignavibacteriae-2]|nr:transcriptional repressor [Bacteroidota bacterium]PKL89669.1 MAG: transcriptional repressor [Ignavibacteriae bacterium HGW-Ignavibacteriae-2]
MDKSNAHEQFKKFLKKGKHRITPERFEVLDFALEYKGHFAADELYIKMKNNDSNVSRATVYNTLELLEQCDLLAKRHFGDNKKYYESSFNRKNHDHLICTKCGKITEFSNAKINEVVDSICSQLGFESSGYSFNIFGRCKDEKCENKE